MWTIVAKSVVHGEQFKFCSQAKTKTHRVL